jgi:hypothetical protein
MRAFMRKPAQNQPAQNQTSDSFLPRSGSLRSADQRPYGRGPSADVTQRSGFNLSRVPTFSDASEALSTAGRAGFKTTATAGGRTGTSLDVTFTVSDTKAASLQVIQTFMGTRRSDGVKVGTYSWKSGSTTWDAFVDGGKNSPFVAIEGNAPAHATEPYYLTASEVASQVSFAGDAGTIEVTDTPGAAALHDEAHFETAIVAVDFNGKKKDKILKAFKWGWTGKGTKEDFAKGSKIAGADSGVQMLSGVTPGFKNIVKHDYPSYDYF